MSSCKRQKTYYLLSFSNSINLGRVDVTVALFSWNCYAFVCNGQQTKSHVSVIFFRSLAARSRLTTSFFCKPYNTWRKTVAGGEPFPENSATGSPFTGDFAIGLRPESSTVSKKNFKRKPLTLKELRHLHWTVPTSKFILTAQALDSYSPYEFVLLF